MKTDRCTYMITSRSVLLTKKNVWDKICRENQYTQFIFHKLFFNCAVYEIQWKNNVEPNGSQITIWRMWIAYLMLALQSLRKCNVFLLFQCNNGCPNAPQSYVILKFPVLLYTLI
jgi:hypothetical protein